MEDGGLDFRVLGPFGARADGRELRLGGLRSQRILATLLLSSNRVVTLPRLIEAAWDAAPPATARRQVQNRIAALRGVLLRAGGSIQTHHAGYSVAARWDELDLSRFDRLVGQAYAATHQATTASKLRAALELWRGPALAGLGGTVLDAEALRLEERRLAVLGDCIDLELAAGAHTRLVPELHRLVREHPFRERHVAQLMLALYRDGRQGDALDIYRSLWIRLAEELALQPARELQDLQDRILAGDHTLKISPVVVPGPVATSAPTPQQLPSDIPSLAGRDHELAKVLGIIDDVDGRVPIIVIHGTGGIGKSALAVHAAHRVVDRFPDGQLYVDLQGATAGLQPLPPIEALGRFLRSLGVHGDQVPAEACEAAARFRSETAVRRLLLLLDNAHDTAQVKHLLPGSAGCAVLVTSRRMLSGVDGAHHLSLGVLSEADAVTQLADVLGDQRVREEPAAATAVASWCGRLPLALRIAATRLSTRPDWPLHAMASSLADEQRRLDELELTDIGVRASVGVSHDGLLDSGDPTDHGAANAYAVLSLLDGPDFGVPAAARLLDLPEPRAEHIVERLVDTSLLGSPAARRYRYHDLLRLHARELGARLFSPDERATALGRVFGYYLATSWNAYARVRPGDYRLRRRHPRWLGGGDFASATAALDWSEQERPNLVAAVRQAADVEKLPSELTLQLAHALYAFFRVRGYWNDIVDVNRTAFAVAERSGDRRAAALVLTDLGAALSQQGHYGEAIRVLKQAAAAHRDLGDIEGQAQSVGNLGVVRQLIGEYEAALQCHRKSLALWEQSGNERGQAMSLGNLGPALRQLRRYKEALASHERGLALFRSLDDEYGRAVSLGNLGVLLEQMGTCDEALSALRESLTIHRDMGDRQGEATALERLGRVLRQRGEYRDALTHLRQALAIHRILGHGDVQAMTLREISRTLALAKQPEQAQACWQRAAPVTEGHRVP